MILLLLILDLTFWSWIINKQYTKMNKCCWGYEALTMFAQTKTVMTCNSPVPEPTMSLLGDSDMASASLSLKPSSVASTEDMWRKPKLSGQLPHTSRRVTLWSNVPVRDREKERGQLDINIWTLATCCCNCVWHPCGCQVSLTNHKNITQWAAQRRNSWPLLGLWSAQYYTNDVFFTVRWSLMNI